MEEILIKFDNNIDRYRALAEKYVEKGDLVRALSFLHTANLSGNDIDVLSDLAELYSIMGLYDISNNFWFKYIDRATKDKVSVAYEELAINFFYMDNLLASSYYLQKKVATDGFISKDGIDQEILDYFSAVTTGRDAYHIAYPFDVADYSKELKQAKRALVAGDLKGAVRRYENIPEGCKQYKDALNELSVAYFLSGDTEKGIETSRKSLKCGEDLISCSNLASMYKYANDIDKSQYYYSKALTFTPSNTEEHYKLATVSLEHGETSIAIKHLEKVLKDREYETKVRFLYSIALINDKKYSLALENLKELFIIVPFDNTIKYYLNLAERLVEETTRVSAEKLLPLAYVDDLPEAERKFRVKAIKQLSICDDKTRSKYLKKEEYREYLSWGISCGDKNVAKASIFILAEGDDSSLNVLFNALMSSEISSEIKRLIIFMIILNGYKHRFGLVSHNFYLTIKPKKLPCEKDILGKAFFSAYALCVSFIAFTGTELMDKIAINANKVYKKFVGTEASTLYTTEEFASLITLLLNAQGLGEKQIAEIFSVKRARLKKLKLLYEGKENEIN